ncbi:Uncharacterised protein [Arcanobacterium haemolyticum]|nr:Uncharacterised protein [Arcanobacterium haemolyticum]
MEIHTRSLRRQTITKLAATPLSPRRKRTRIKLLDAGSVLIIEKGILGTSVGIFANVPIFPVAPSIRTLQTWIISSKHWQITNGLAS